MKPRQNVKNHYIPPAYQYQNSNNTPSSRDIDLTKLGPLLDEMPNLQANSNLANQEDILKCLQQLYSKSNTGDLLQNLPSIGDWPMQSASPHDSRVLGGSGGLISGGSGLGSNNPCYNNIGTINNNNNNISETIHHRKHQPQQQDGHFSSGGSAASNSQQLQSTSALANFILSQSSMHSLQQPVQPQQKSVLSLHQPHQSDLSNRRLNSHHMSASNTSFANLNSVSATNAATSINSSSDLNNISSIGGNGNGGKTQNPSSSTHLSGLDTFGPIDNMFYDNSMMMSAKDMPSTANQQSLIRHQQLQKLLKSTGSQLRSSSSPSNTPISHRNNESQSQCNITSNNMSQMQLPVSSPASAISPPQSAFSNVPKSLLNLAACTSSSPSTSSTPTLPSVSKFSSMVSQMNLMSKRSSGTGGQVCNKIQTTTSNTTNSYRSQSRQGCGNYDGNNIMTNLDTSGNHKSTIANEYISRTNASLSGAAIGNMGTNLSKQTSMSLLSEDQSSISASNRSNMNPRNSCNINNVTNLKNPSHSQHTPPITPSKDAYLASLQERAARAGVSIGEISRPNQTASATISATSNNDVNQMDIANQVHQRHQNSVIISPGQVRDESTTLVDRKEIESAISRVEARNDLSLLYPSTLLGSKSQRQVNALSAGLHSSDNESVAVTEEVKKIVLEECNIIYECKECKNLFRSLANLVKHKRTYCTQDSMDKIVMEAHQQTHVNNSSMTMDRRAIAYNSSRPSPESTNQSQKESNLARQISDDITTDNDVSKGIEQLNNLSSMIRLIHNQEKKNNERDPIRQKGSSINYPNPHSVQTSLSQLLQSQPKSRLPTLRDNTLIGALNTVSDQPSIYDSDKSIMNDQLVKNSSLAKTLLNEKARGTSDLKQSPNEIIPRGLDTTKILLQNRVSSRRSNPKRKFLEDCIQKVKRDKIVNEDDEDEPIPVSTPNPRATVIKTTCNLGQQQDDKDTLYVEQESCSATSDVLRTNSYAESDVDSDMLMIDLDGPQRKESPRIGGNRRISTAASSTASSTSSIKHLNNSSALLKALTRPVDSKRPTTFNTNTLPAESSRPTSHANLSLMEGELVNKLPKHKEQATNSEIISETVCDVAENHSINEEEDSIKIDAEAEPNSNKDSGDVLNSSHPVENIKEDKPPTRRIDNTSDDDGRYSPLFDKYTCDICKLDKDDLSSLMDHTIKHHPKEKMIYPCLFCSLSFIALENVCRHIIDIHKKQKEQVYRLKEVVQSRSFISSDCVTCIDYPSTSPTIQDQSETKESDRDDGQVDDCNELDLFEQQSENSAVRSEDDIIEVESRSEPEEQVTKSSSTSSSSANSSSGSSNSSRSSDSNSDSLSSSSSSSSPSSGSANDQEDEEIDEEDVIGEDIEESADDNKRMIIPPESRPASSMLVTSKAQVKMEQLETSINDLQQGDLQPTNSSSKQISSFDHNNSRSRSPLIAVDDNDSEAYNESEGEMEYDSASPNHNLGASNEVTEQGKMHPKQPSTASKPAAETTPSSSSGVSGGGIMKLKIQLKTRPDEKSKVYEIV